MRLWYNFLLPYYEWVAVGQSQPSKNVSKTLRCVDWVILHVLFFSNFPFLPYFLLLCIFCWTSCPYECMMKLIFQPLTFYICIPYSIISYYLREDSGMKLHILPFFFYHPLIDKLLISRNSWNGTYYIPLAIIHKQLQKLAAIRRNARKLKDRMGEAHETRTQEQEKKCNMSVPSLACWAVSIINKYLTGNLTKIWF